MKLGSNANFHSQCLTISLTRSALPSNLVLSSILAMAVLFAILVWVVGTGAAGVGLVGGGGLKGVGEFGVLALPDDDGGVWGLGVWEDDATGESSSSSSDSGAGVGIGWTEKACSDTGR